MIPISGLSGEQRGARHAALLLHAMAPADRAWMLDALPPGERVELQRLLAELEALGIERDPALIDAATVSDEFDAPVVSSFRAAPGEAPVRAALSDEALLHALDDEGVAALARIVRTEPAGLVAEWLSLATWPWRDALLQTVEPAQRRRIETHLANMPAAAQTPPGLRQALISMVAARLRERPPIDAPSSTPWHKLRYSLVGALQKPLRRLGAAR